MIRIGTIWDRTSEVIAGRFGILASIAALLLFAPSVLQAAVAAATGESAGPKIVAGLLGLAVAIVTLWGGLALTAVASDPATGQREAIDIGLKRLGAALGVTAVALVAVLLVSLPGIALIAGSGFDFARAEARLPQAGLDGGRIAFALLWFCLEWLALLIVGARLLPLLAVVVNERLGVGAFARTFALTRGSTLRLIGVLILYVIVLLVVLAATTSIFGLVARLLLGSESQSAVGFVTAVVTAAVSAVFGVLQNVFSAQFYLAARDAA